MIINQIAFVTDLKAELIKPEYGIDAVKEYLTDLPVTLSANYECFINGSSTTKNGDTETVVENSYYQVILCIAKSEFISGEIELIKRTALGKVKTAIYAALEVCTELDDWKVLDEVQVLDNDIFNNETYIAFSVRLTIQVTNSY